MDRSELKKLEKAEKLLYEALAILHELRQDVNLPSSTPDTAAADFDASAFLGRIRSLERGSAAAELAELKQNQLGSIFGLAGGPPNDKKKPKNWLIEQILWRVFDFQRGQSAIRKEFEKKS